MPPRRSGSVKGTRRSTSTTGSSKRAGAPALRRVRTADNMDRRKFRNRGESPGAAAAAAMEDKSSKSEGGNGSTSMTIGDVKWKRTGSKSPTRRGTVRSKSDNTMSASSPGFSSERRRTASPDGQPMDARERAMSVLERIERRTSQASASSLDLDLEDSMQASQGKGLFMSQSTPGGSSRGRGGQGSFHSSFHSSVAKRFLENTGDESEESDEFDLKVSTIMGVGKYSGKPPPPPTRAKPKMQKEDSWMGMLSDSLHSLENSIRSSAGFMANTNTLGHRSESDDDDDEEMHDLDHSDSSEHEIQFEKSLFSNRLREDLHQVDQSVNLMNAEAGKYDWSHRGKRTRGLKPEHTAHKTMVELFLSSSDKTTNGGSGSPPKKKKRELFCDCGVLCCLFVLTSIVATAFLVSPYFADQEWPSLAHPPHADSSTESPTASPTTATTKTKPPNAGEANLENTRPPPAAVTSSLKSPFYDADVVQQREVALEELLQATSAGIITNSVAARKANAWLVAYDPAQLDLTKADSSDQTKFDILQRYALSVLFFVAHPDVQPSTAPHEPSSNTRQSSEGNDGRRRHLQHHLTFVDWMTASHVCWWEGIGCNINKDRHVDQMELAESRITGTLPPELGLLTSLQQVDLSHNHLQGDVPKEWAGTLSQLATLQLHDNELTGTVPTEYCQLDHLDTFTSDCSTTELECECCTECL